MCFVVIKLMHDYIRGLLEAITEMNNNGIEETGILKLCNYFKTIFRFQLCKVVV